MHTKPEQTPQQRALRLRAYEMYLTTDLDGRRPSLRSIAMSLGVTLGTVQYWRKRDKWDERIYAALKASNAATERASGALGALLRQSLFEHVGTLNTIIRDTATRTDVRIKAIGELADICHKLKAIDPASLMDDRKPTASFDFKDDLDGTTPENHDELPCGAPAAASDADHDHDLSPGGPRPGESRDDAGVGESAHRGPGDGFGGIPGGDG